MWLQSFVRYRVRVYVFTGLRRRETSRCTRTLPYTIVHDGDICEK